MKEVVQTLTENPITDNVARPSPHARAKTGASASVSGEGALLPSHQPPRGLDSAFSHQSDPTNPTTPRNASSPLYAKALHAFEGQDTNELSFEKGAMLKVLKRTTSKGWVCEHEGQRGYVPGNYLAPVKDKTLSEGQPSGYAKSHFHSPPINNERSHSSEKGKTPHVPDAPLPSSFERGYF